MADRSVDASVQDQYALRKSNKKGHVEGVRLLVKDTRAQVTKAILLDAAAATHESVATVEKSHDCTAPLLAPA